MIRTLDGGKTWESMRSGTSIDLAAVRFVNESVGFMTGSGEVIFKTTDGGTTWEPNKIPFESHGSGFAYELGNLGVRDERTYCAADTSTAACTENGGKDWRIHYFYRDKDRRYFSFIGISVTPDSFYFVTRCDPDNDVITTDNLKTWKYVK